MAVASRESRTRREEERKGKRKRMDRKEKFHFRDTQITGQAREEERKKGREGR